MTEAPNMLAQAVEDVEEVRMLLVELGDIEHCGKTGFCEVLPALFGADADAALRGQADQTRVGNAQGLHDLTGKVEVAGVIENVDLALVIFHRNDRRRDGILALLLFVVEVGNGRAVRALAQTGDRLGRKEHALAQRGLAVAAVTQQADVANVIGSIAHSQIFSFLQPGTCAHQALGSSLFSRLLNFIIYESGADCNYYLVQTDKICPIFSQLRRIISVWLSWM